MRRYIWTFHIAKADDLAQEPIMQLFYNRLVDEIGDPNLGGRYKQFYAGQDCKLPGTAVNFDDLKKMKWRINGLDYDQTLEDAFAESLEILSPESYPTYGAVVAHGDAHNGNVWFNKTGLTLFDPAFAGKHMPALLAEIKATFHNIFAHPLWLYDSQEADGLYEVRCEISNGVIKVEHNWQLSKLREAFLQSKIVNLWAPLLKHLVSKGALPDNWKKYMRLALFCCPTLVMNLRADSGSEQNSHTARTSLLGFAIAIMLSSPPSNGKDMISEFFTKITP